MLQLLCHSLMTRLSTPPFKKLIYCLVQQRV